MATDEQTITEPLDRFGAVSSAEEFWRLTAEVWRHGVYGVDLGKILVAIGIVIVALAVRRLFTWAVLNRLSAYAERTDTRIDNKAVEALRAPVRFIPVVIGIFVALEYLGLTGDLDRFATNLVRSLIIFTIFWAFFRLIAPLSFLLGRLERVFTAAMVDWLVKAIKLLIAFLGVATVLEVWGIEVGPILAGLGLFGVAVALGAQDLFKNLIAGLSILVERRFSIGDWVQVDGVVEGVVETIGFRSTFIRRFDQAPVFVPNAQLADAAITNFSRMTFRRIYWVIGVEYRTTNEQLHNIRDRIEEYILKTEGFATPEEAPTFVRIDSFGASSIDIMLYCFTRTTVWAEWLAIKEALAYEIKRIVEGEGAAFAFPSTSIYVETLPDGSDTPESFSPPEEDAGTRPAAREGARKGPKRGSTDTPQAEAGDGGEGA